MSPDNHRYIEFGYRPFIPAQAQVPNLRIPSSPLLQAHPYPFMQQQQRLVKVASFNTYEYDADDEDAPGLQRGETRAGRTRLRPH